MDWRELLLLLSFSLSASKVRIIDGISIFSICLISSRKFYAYRFHLLWNQYEIRKLCFPLVDEIYRLSNDIFTLHNIYDNITSFGLVFISVTLVFCLLFQRSSSKKLLILHMVMNTKQLGQPILWCSKGSLGITRQLQKWYFSFAKIKTQCFFASKGHFLSSFLFSKETSNTLYLCFTLSFRLKVPSTLIIQSAWLLDHLFEAWKTKMK